MKYHKLIKKWASLRHHDPKFADIAVRYYEGLSKDEQEAMLKEFKEYIEAVKSGRIEAGPISLPKLHG